jgi:DNA polymerase I
LGVTLEWSEEACIISGDNLALPGNVGKTAIELWGRSKSGHSVLLLVHGFNPYIEISDPGTNSKSTSPSLSLESVSEDWRVVGSPLPLGNKLYEGNERPHWRVFLKEDIMKSKLRSELSTQGWDVTSSDIFLVHRLLMDCDLGPHISYSGEVLWVGERAPEEISRVQDADSASERIKELGGAGLYPVDLIVSCNVSDLKRVEPFPTPFVTFSYDLETSVKHNTILCAAAVIDRSGERTTHEFIGSEKEIMEGLTRLVRDEDPDFITGYNIDNFDLPRTLERSEENSNSFSEQSSMFGWGRVPLTNKEIGVKKIGRIFPKRQQNRVWRISGRIPLDAWWQARQTLSPQRESLRYVSNLLWPEQDDKQKLDVDASQMDMEWANRPEEVMEYCVRDTILPLDILEKLKSIPRKEALASVSSTTVETASAGTTSQWIDSLVVRLADRNGVAIPMTNRTTGRREQIAGGYVHEVEPGVKNWVAVLDFKSMYPSIMISNNICSTTLIRDSAIESSHFISPITNTRYLSKDVRIGLVPLLLQDLMDSRDKYKKAYSQALENGDEDEAFLNDQLQYAVKILMNSFYGVFASSFYRFTHEKLGASITEWARYNITEIISNLEKDGYDVVYSDTDSIFVCTMSEENTPAKKPDSGSELLAWESAKEETIKLGEQLASQFTKAGAELEFETALSAFFSHGAKKRYVGRVIWPREELLIRGYEVRRTDSFGILSTTMTEMFELILEGDEEGAIDLAKSVITEVQQGKIPPSDLIVSRSCKGTWDKRYGKWVFDKIYANPDSLPYVRAAKERISRGLQFTPGMKVGYIITNSKSSPMEVKAWLVDEIGGEPPKPDPQYYVNRLAKSLGRITSALNFDESKLKDYAKNPSTQKSLFDF